jgi:hypothetical protein
MPGRWFGESTPLLDTVLNSLSAGWVGFFNLFAYLKSQTRIATSFDDWLDLTAEDFFGWRVTRRILESDNSFRARISLELVRDRCTRAALYQCLLDSTGRPPIIFEPANPQDTGCYGTTASPGYGVAGYGTSGGWGSLDLPFQVFVRAFRPVTPGISMINGWNGSVGGFGAGLSAYMSFYDVSSQVTDAEICEGIAHTAPAGCVVWISIEP